jgi:hypothetical protein
MFMAWRFRRSIAINIKGTIDWRSGAVRGKWDGGRWIVKLNNSLSFSSLSKRNPN